MISYNQNCQIDFRREKIEKQITGV